MEVDLQKLLAGLTSAIGSSDSQAISHQLLPLLDQLLGLMDNHNPKSKKAKGDKSEESSVWPTLLQAGLKFLPDLLALL